MYRFSREKRLFLPVSFEEFLETAQSLVTALQRTDDRFEVKVLTCEDPTTYQYSNVTFWADEVERALQNRKQYTLQELTNEVWKRSLKVEVYINDPSTKEPFMIVIGCDKHGEGSRILFYGQGMSEDFWDEIVATLAEGNLKFKIGDGMPRLTNFNIKFGERITGIPLR